MYYSLSFLFISTCMENLSPFPHFHTVSLDLNGVSYRQHIYGYCFFYPFSHPVSFDSATYT